MKKLAKDWQLDRWLFDILRKFKTMVIYQNYFFEFSDNHNYEF
jgi:hypothetical protein